MCPHLNINFRNIFSGTMAKKSRKVFNLTEYSEDVTINDFANSSVPKTGRIKKNEINNVISKVKNLSVAKNDESWNEKLKHLDGHHIKIKNGSKKTLKSKRGNYVTRKNTSDENNIAYYNKYPIELWFKISEYVAPEDVGRFASICHDTLAVVLSARFWYRLYKRYYKEVPDLPELLQPKCIRKYGLRTNVIRALYYTYPPFVNKLKSETSFNGDPHSLVKRICVLSWSQKKKNQWLFCFKLKCSQLVRQEKCSESERKPGLLEMLEDINANVDYGCKVLEVISMNYVPLPMISGQRLNGVSLTLSQDLQHHRLELNFGCSTSPHMGNNFVTLDSVLKIRVLDWWHPSFPHSNGLNCTSYSNESNFLMDEIDFNVS